MPYFDRGSVVYPVEDSIERPDELGKWLLARLGEGCRCVVIDSPFAARVERRGLSIDYTIGVGSIVCDGCGGGGDVVLEEPAWGRGRVIVPGTQCLFHGACDELYSGLGVLGFKLKRVGLDEFLDAVGRGGESGVAVLGDESPRLEVELVGSNVCGRLEAVDPLHPSGAVGKPGLEGCVDTLYTLVGPMSRLLYGVLRFSDGKPLVSRLAGMGEGLVLGYSLAGASRYLRLAALLGALYTCSREAE